MAWKLSDLLTEAQRKQLRVKAPVAPRPKAEKAYIVCPTGKAPYPTRADADARLRELVDMACVTDMRSYRCAYCMQFHFGHRRGVA
jgi:hypothetical protein